MNEKENEMNERDEQAAAAAVSMQQAGASTYRDSSGGSSLSRAQCQ